MQERISLTVSFICFALLAKRSISYSESCCPHTGFFHCTQQIQLQHIIPEASNQYVHVVRYLLRHSPSAHSQGMYCSVKNAVTHPNLLAASLKPFCHVIIHIQRTQGHSHKNVRRQQLCVYLLMQVLCLAAPRKPHVQSEPAERCLRQRACVSL